MGNSSQENGHLGYQPHRAVRDLGRTQVTLPHSHITGRGRSTAINAAVLTVSREPWFTTLLRDADVPVARSGTSPVFRERRFRFLMAFNDPRRRDDLHVRIIPAYELLVPILLKSSR